MAVLDDRLQDRRRPLLALGAKRMAAFHDAPAVVAAFFDLVDRFPQILADLAGPQIAGRGVEADLPRLPDAIRPDLAARPLMIGKRIVGGNAVVPGGVGPVDVDAQ